MYEVWPVGSSMRPNCCTLPLGSNCHHCAAARDGPSVGSTLCDSHSEPLRYRVLMMTLVLPLILTSLPNCAVSGVLPLQPSGAVASATCSKVSLPTAPVIR